MTVPLNPQSARQPERSGPALAVSQPAPICPSGQERKGTRSRVPQSARPTTPLTAPTARPIPAWGEAPCTAAPQIRGLKARPIAPSIPHIPLVAFNSILLQERPKLLLKIALPVMRFLTLDVLDQGLQIRRPNRERAISSLPCELRQRGRLRLDPLGRGRFEVFHQLRNRRCARQSNRQMNVVGNASHAIAFTFGVANDSSKISIERRTYRSVELRRSILRAEDHMNEQKRERLWHRSDYRSGLQPSTRSAVRDLGLRPRLVYPAPSALIAHSCFTAPTARPIPAWGATPCTQNHPVRGLKARPIKVRHTSSLEDE